MSAEKYSLGEEIQIKSHSKVISSPFLFQNESSKVLIPKHKLWKAYTRQKFGPNWEAAGLYLTADFVQMTQFSTVGGMPLQDPTKEPSWKHDDLEIYKGWRKILEATYTNQKETIKKKKNQKKNSLLAFWRFSFASKGENGMLRNREDRSCSKLAQGQSPHSSPHYSSHNAVKKRTPSNWEIGKLDRT